MEIITALKDTPIPTLLVIGGLIFIFLGIATIKKPIVIDVAPSSRRIALIIGTILVGTGLYLISLPSSGQPEHNKLTDEPETISTSQSTEQSDAIPTQTNIQKTSSAVTDDIVWQLANGQVHYWPIKKGQLGEGIDIGVPIGSEWSIKGIGDVNGDGTDDIVWQLANGQVHYWPIKKGQLGEGIDIGVPIGSEWSIKGVGNVDE